MITSISIITATYNAAAHLRHSFASLNAQTIPCEHIVIDGGSVDETTMIIEEYRSGIDHLVLEPDHGLYDALNKGINVATGDVVGILHADDFYASNDVLENVSTIFKDPAVEACYGDLVYVDEKHDLGNYKFRVLRYWQSQQYAPKLFYWGWMPPHPTFFVRRSVYEKYGLFNLELGTAADYELILRFLLKHKVDCRYIPKVLVSMRTGGMSNRSLRNRLKANRMDRKAWSVNELEPLPWTFLVKPLRKLPQWWRRPP